MSDAPQSPCPHGRPAWQMCPHCNGVNEYARQNPPKVPATIRVVTDVGEIVGPFTPAPPDPLTVFTAGELAEALRARGWTVEPPKSQDPPP